LPVVVFLIHVIMVCSFFASEVKPTQSILLFQSPCPRSGDWSACRTTEALVDYVVFETDLYEHPESRVTCEAWGLVGGA
jgi:hypothetical protein